MENKREGRLVLDHFLFSEKALYKVKASGQEVVRNLDIQ